MWRAILTMTIGFVMLGATLGADTLSIPLRYKLSLDNERYYGGNNLRQNPNLAKSLKLPKLNSKKPLFFAVNFGVAQTIPFAFVLDESEPGGGYDLLYVDHNRNHDLTDEKPIRSSRKYSWREFGPFPLLLEVEGQRVLYHLGLTEEVEGGRSPTYWLFSGGYYEGELLLNGRTYKVALRDDNVNGLFNDLWHSPRHYGDTLLVDLNGNGTFEEWSEENPESFMLARLIQLNGRFYEVNPAPTGNLLTLKPAEVELVTLRSAYERFMLQLSSEEYGVLALSGEKGEVKVPKGAYRLLHWLVVQKDSKGRAWSLLGDYGVQPSRAPKLRVDSDRELPALASKLVAQVHVDSQEKREVRFSLTFKTETGYTLTDVRCGKQRMPEPRLRILDAKGKQLAELKFHYG